jgi:hypothetical protein
VPAHCSVSAGRARPRRRFDAPPDAYRAREVYRAAVEVYLIRRTQAACRTFVRGQMQADLVWSLMRRWLASMGKGLMLAHTQYAFLMQANDAMIQRKLDLCLIAELRIRLYSRWHGA